MACPVSVTITYAPMVKRLMLSDGNRKAVFNPNSSFLLFLHNKRQKLAKIPSRTNKFQNYSSHTYNCLSHKQNNPQVPLHTLTNSFRDAARSNSKDLKALPP